MVAAVLYVENVCEMVVVTLLDDMITCVFGDMLRTNPQMAYAYYESMWHIRKTYLNKWHPSYPYDP
jgi:hypothetical protein